MTPFELNRFLNSILYIYIYGDTFLESFSFQKGTKLKRINYFLLRKDIVVTGYLTKNKEKRDWG